MFHLISNDISPILISFKEALVFIVPRTVIFTKYYIKYTATFETPQTLAAVLKRGVRCLDICHR